MVTVTDRWELRFGDFDMTPGARGTGSGSYRVLVRGLRRGKPVPVTEVVESMFQDGALERRTRYDNRENMQIVIAIDADDSDLQAQAEEDLFLEVQKDRNELAWTPLDGEGATSVFDVLWCDLDPFDTDDWDMLEWNGLRAWVLTPRCLPFARDPDPITVPALASGVTPATTTIADGTSATNWTGLTTITASGGTLRQTVGVSPTPIPGGGTSYRSTSDWTYQPASPITAFATQRYLAVDVLLPYVGYSAGGSVSAYADGVVLEQAAIVSLSSGITRYFFVCTDTSVAALKIHIDWQNAFAPGATGISSSLHQIDQVFSTNQAPSTPSTPGREALRTLAIEGSARTSVSLAIEHATDGLGQVLVYTCPALDLGGYAPDLRRTRVSGSSETTSSNSMSGKTSGVSTISPEVFQIPIAPLPRGGYLLLAKPTGPAFTDVQVTVSTRLANGTLIGTKVTRNRAVQTVAGFSILTDLTLPIVDVPPGAGALVELSVLSTSGGSIAYDEMFLCALVKDAALTLVDAGAISTAALGSANSRLWVDGPTIDQPAPVIWMGTAADKADAYHAGGSAGSWMNHQFPPGEVTLFVANSGGANPAISGKYYRRSHTHMTRRQSA